MSQSATEICEGILRRHIESNIQQDILASETAVAKRLLARSTELAQAYDEVYGKLRGKPYALDIFMGMLLSLQAFWSRQDIAKARRERGTLQNVNERIEELAFDLAELLEQRNQLHNTSGFASSTLYHIVDVIDRANQGNGFYSSHLRNKLLPLANQYDLKYWPEVADCLRVLAQDAASAEIEATDPLTEAATMSSRPSTSDSVWAFLAFIEESKGDFEGRLPVDFKLTDKTMADLLNVVLDLSPETLLTSERIKGIRHRPKKHQS